MRICAAALDQRRGYSYWGKVLSQVVDRRRYSPHGRFGALAAAKRESSGLPQLYRGRAASSFKDLYETDHAESRQGGRFRWLISTCLAGTVGAISILVVIYGSADKHETRGGFLPGLTELGEANLAGRDVPFVRNSEGLKWAAPKSDRLNITSGAVTVRYSSTSPSSSAASAANTSTPSPTCASSRAWRRCRPTARRRSRRSIRSASTPRRR